jgi:CarboxypepD_reg-like domain
MITSQQLILVFFSFLSSSLIAQTEVKGKVIDSDGKPVQGVNVVIMGTSQGVVTNHQGGFVIGVPEGKSTLLFSFIGYKQWEQKIEIDKNFAYEAQITLMEEKLKHKKKQSSGKVKSRALSGEIQ